MKNLSLIFLFALTSYTWAANISRSHEVSFALEDFTLSYETNGNLQISSSISDYFTEEYSPGLPWIPCEITLEGQYTYISSVVNCTKRLVKSNVIVNDSPIPTITDSLNVLPAPNNVTYPYSIYPNANCKYTSQSRWSDFTIFRFLICPFVYDLDKKQLFFIESVNIDVTASADDIKLNNDTFGKVPSAIRRLTGQDSEASLHIAKISNAPDSNGLNADIEYLIIAADSLRDAFEPLLNWKRTKGLKSQIISIEEILSTYSGTRNTLKIKNCLYDLFVNKGLVYVLLGGDDTIIPIQGCYSHVNKNSVPYYIDDTIPSDIFYSCFDGDFGWDGNQNGIYGEIDDNINFTQYIYVTRVPVRSKADASSFVSKLLKYEKEPDWSNKMLMCGTQLWRKMKDSTQSDAEAQGDNLYAKYIKPYWNGERYKFYDTMTDFTGAENYNLTSLNLSRQLANGYDFVDMITHGGQTGWSMEVGSNYSSDHAKTQKNIRSTIITTTACNTNAFDISDSSGGFDPCLSESLIRNPTSGVIAYLGSSRYGWGFSGSDEYGGSSQLGSSLQYESYFYKYLLNKDCEMSNYGELVAAAKNSLAIMCSSYNSHRWLQLALNPIGDPEMPIYIEQPKEFNNLEFEQTPEKLIIKTGADNCKICVMSAQDFGNSYHKVYDSVDKLTLDVFPIPYSICITKHGYIPALYNLSYDSKKSIWIIQNEKLSGKNFYMMDNVELGSNITENLQEGNVEVNSGTTEIIAKSVTLQPGFSVKKGAKFKITKK